MKPYFKLRAKADSKGLHQVYLFYSNKGVILRIPMKFKVPKIYWVGDRVIAKIKDVGLDAITINQELQENLTRLNNIIIEYRRKEMVVNNPDIEYVKEKFYSNDVTKNGEDTLYKLFVDYTDMKVKDVQSPNRIKSVLKELELFLSVKKNKVFLKDVNEDFLDNFKHHMMYRTTKKKDKDDNFIEGQCNITVKKKLGVFISFLKKMDKKKLNVPDFYKTYEYNLSKGPSKHIGLENFEVELLYNLDLKDKPYLERVRDKFLVACWTGLRFSDIFLININSVRKDENGFKFLQILSSKTDTDVFPPLTPKCEQVLERNNWSLEKISNQKANEYLKELFRTSKVESFKRVIDSIRKVGKDDLPMQSILYDVIHFHEARSFFITEALSRGVPMNQVMRWTGHTGGFKVFEDYINIKRQGNFINLMY